jgi:aspartate carbamoyltransferase catalytic subunit
MGKKLDATALINGFKGQDILSIAQFDQPRLFLIFALAKQMKQLLLKNKSSDLLEKTITTLLFFEPSSRTFSSFAAAARRLNGTTIDILNPSQTSSVAKGESFSDTIRALETNTDCIVIRHPEIGSAQKAADAAFFVPIINAGDGAGEHPTQALMDLFTIYEHHNTLQGLTGVIAGDLLNGRTVHSLLKGLSLFEKNTIYLLSSKQLRIPRVDWLHFQNKGLKIVEIEKESDIPKNAHFWYWTRVQTERFKNTDVKKIPEHPVITTTVLELAGRQTIIMHPLPRIDEIHPDVDRDPRAMYFRSQIQNGLPIRMVLLSLVLGKI